MNINIEQLKEIHKMQQDFDRRIHEERGLDSRETYIKRIVAFNAEFAELLQELPTTFKYWKKTAIDNHEKALEEFVDCVHFALSMSEEPRYRQIHCESDITSAIYEVLCSSTDSFYQPTLIWRLLNLGDLLGFTWGEIYQGYLAKNAVNHGRQDRGY